VQQATRYSITSSARSKIDVGVYASLAVQIDVVRSI